MAQTIEIAGETYSNVPSIDVPLASSGIASFYDISSSTVTASDMLNGVKAYNANGVEVTGTIQSKSSSDLTISGATVTVPKGNYASNASATIASGTATTPATTISVNPTISVSSGGLITSSYSGSQTVIPTVSAGYISSGIGGTINVSGSKTEQLSTQGAQTITPTTIDQTISSGLYLTGTQTIKGDANLIAANIAKDVTIFGVIGTHEGGGVSAYAYIVVEYPSDATSVTCTNTSGSIALSSTMKLFLVSNNTSSCVVTISKTNNTVSKTVTVASGESYYVIMMFMHRFVYNGVIQGSSLTTDTRKDISAAYGQKPTVSYDTGYISITAGGSGTYNGAGTAYFPETIDLTPFTTIHVQGSARNNTGEKTFCAADVWSSIGSNQAENRRALVELLPSSTSSFTSFDITVDVSTYTDASAYIGFNVRRNGSGYSAIRLTDVWIE